MTVVVIFLSEGKKAKFDCTSESFVEFSQIDCFGTKPNLLILQLFYFFIVLCYVSELFSNPIFMVFLRQHVVRHRF